MDPVILFFILGVTAGLLRSELRLPSALYDSLSMILLLSIGLKGGVELAKQPAGQLIPQILAVVGLGLVIPAIAFVVLFKLGRLSRVDAAAIAAHYGSVSVATYAVAVSYFEQHAYPFESHIPLLLAVMEVPAIVVGLLLARGFSRSMEWGHVAREIFLGKSIVLLLGGLAIGWAAGPKGLTSVEFLFVDLFKGLLALFLLEMGIIAASQLESLKRHGLFLLGFGIAMPLLSSVLGALTGFSLGLSIGGTAMIAVLAASASYIAVPAALRISLPEANPTLSLSTVLGVTFPFNVLVGVPLYYALAERVHAVFGG